MSPAARSGGDDLAIAPSVMDVWIDQKPALTTDVSSLGDHLRIGGARCIGNADSFCNHRIGMGLF
ncbi:hypothetical protein AF72_12630 [Xylella taiwanensis]|uniref:Uncharacterized protein n=1 Tax=Xylella taiwanensis TaxID=1444770 RepID=Z9JGG8_9GAMM|nr:hypothetical protein AB672_04450 [Xylella taiwanensis]EWS77088.1 hypothetical protein AF72_12630 [Xylella taiwanensis]